MHDCKFYKMLCIVDITVIILNMYKNKTKATKVLDTNLIFNYTAIFKHTSLLF